MLGGSAEVIYDRGYPAVVNSAAEAALVREVAEQVVEPEHVIEMTPMMGGEDFSYYLERVPGAFVIVGAGNPQMGATFPHHHPRFDIDESAMATAAEVLGRSALMYMSRHQA